MAERYRYVGQELELFALATNWKRYFRRHLRPFIRGDVLEVGSGIGSVTRVLCEAHHRSWTCLEPDATLAGRLAGALRCRPLPVRVEVLTGTTADLPPQRLFDSILYIDVLEHIEDDGGELKTAAGHLCPGGSLVVLAPAHPRLYSEFDAAVGHFRRYDRSSLSAVSPPGLRIERLYYLDSVGCLASMANRLLLRQGMPTRRQIRLWDGLFVSLSRLADPLLGYRLGKTIVGVWRADRRPPAPASAGTCASVL
ncbi:MAG TPA: class I SAM-dependent methyltransferase [Phycisphaerae bacterium]|nr:class I SAM-dependent methyltransferase [Phycisphaerae bacterium]